LGCRDAMGGIGAARWARGIPVASMAEKSVG
jgi:hypothetical protein